MRVEFLDRFNKNLIKIKNKNIFKDVSETIENVELSSNVLSIKTLKNYKVIKMLIGYLVGDFRIGIFVTADTVEFARIVHRRDIYKVFP